MRFILKNGQASAKVSDKGGELISFKLNGTEYVWQGNPDFWSGQAPLLFPVVCSALNGRVEYNGNEYEMPKHGIVRGREFHPIELTSDRAVFRITSDDETKKYYPYDYKLTVTQTLLEDGFETSYTVEAVDDLIFNIGGHPGFNCPLCRGEKFEDYDIIFEDYGNAVMSLTEDGYMNPSVEKLNRVNDNILPLRYSDFDRDCMIIEELPKKKLKVLNRKTNKGFSFDFEGFNAIGIWTAQNKKSPFICLEPWCGLPASVEENGRAEDKKYAVTLKSGERFTVSYTVKVI